MIRAGSPHRCSDAMPVRLVELPVELIATVCADLDQASLSAAARSCSALRDSAIRELWRTPAVFGPKRGLSFAVACVGRPERTGFVAALKCDEEAGLYIFEDREHPPREGTIILPRCSSLELQDSRGTVLVRVLLDQHILLPSLRGLTLRGPQGVRIEPPVTETPTLSSLRVVFTGLDSAETVALYNYRHFANVQTLTLDLNRIYPCDLSGLVELGKHVRRAAIYLHGYFEEFWDKREEEGITSDLGLSDVLPRLESLDLAPGPILKIGLASKPFTCLKAFHLRLPVCEEHPATADALGAVTHALRSGLFPKLETFRVSGRQDSDEAAYPELVELREQLRREGITTEEDDDLFPWEAV